MLPGRLRSVAAASAACTVFAALTALILLSPAGALCSLCIALLILFAKRILAVVRNTVVSLPGKISGLPVFVFVILLSAVTAGQAVSRNVLIPVGAFFLRLFRIFSRITASGTISAALIFGFPRI